MLTESQLQEELRAAMKRRAMDDVYVLRGLLAAIKNLKVEKQADQLAAADIAALVRKEVKKRAEAIDFGKRGNRQDVVDENQRQQSILERYLPPQLGRSELEAVIRDLAAKLNTKNIGPLMAALREHYPGQFDGKLASEIARSLT